MSNEISDFEKNVVDNIRRIRREKGISQERLAAFCDTSASYIGLMETYRNIPKLSTIRRIAEALNVDPIVFFLNSSQEASAAAQIEKSCIQNENITKKIKDAILSSLDKSLDEILKIVG